MDQSQRAEIVVSGDGDDPILEVDGLPVDVPAGRDPMLVGIELVATTATRSGRPVPATVVADDGNWQWRMLVHPDGTTSDDTGDTATRARRRPSRLAVAAIGMVVLAGGGITALAVTTNSDHVDGVAAGSIGAPSPTTPATEPPTPSPASPALPTTATLPTPLVPPTTLPVAATRPVAPAAVPRSVPAPAPVVARTTRPAVAPQAPRRTTIPVPAPAAPAGRLVVISDGAGRCATASGSAVSAGSCTGGAAQNWTATPAGELRQGGRCLVTRSGVALVDCASVPAPARTWTPTGRSPGLVNPATSLCLATTGSTVVAAQCGTGRSLRIA